MEIPKEPYSKVEEGKMSGRERCQGGNPVGGVWEISLTFSSVAHTQFFYKQPHISNQDVEGLKL